MASSPTAPDRALNIRPPGGEGRRFDLHVFSCVTGSNCPLDGPAEAILAHWKTRSKDAEMPINIRFNKSGCLDQCGHGPMVVVYPEGVWYAHLSLEDADRIFDEHFVAGRVPEDLVYKTDAPGKNKLPSKPGEAPDTSHPAYKPCARCPWGPPA